MKKHYYTSILSSLEKRITKTELKQLHGLMITTSVIRYVIPPRLSRLIDFRTNSEAGDFNYAKSVFSRIEGPSVYIWNSMIKTYSNSNNPDEALCYMYREMQRKGYSPDHFPFPFVLKACSMLTDPSHGTSVHS
jgi:pentatricopeptide repeat protein